MKGATPDNYRITSRSVIGSKSTLLPPPPLPQQLQAEVQKDQCTAAIQNQEEQT